ncbi:hypothetical protein F7725_008364 [Dissostichus mawsoni]|uniref:Cationic amino acid transporter C-terminal domain-containing protein n=1 Tax=Dissostichus mawsoni TaxID=36200 RepID=A0A7J5Y896_DISMA|nr:hypothetical protein F7725_008364 [Dissostichus mawsoni]
MLDSATTGTGAHGTKLARVLSTVDLVSLGVGSCVGTGMYVVSGLVAKEMAGPGVIVSFIIAAVASILSGVCYAEFGVRVPKTTGSAYTYSYVTVGECVAFFIGWNLILEYLIGTAAGASALSSMADSLANHTISNFMITHIGTLNGLGKGEQSYPDLLALVIALLVTVIVSLGVKNSVGFNNVLNVINLAVWVFMMIAGLFFVNGENWDDGRFLPFGWSGVSVILTLMVPYDEIDADAPLMEMFSVHGCMFAKYIVAVGSIAGLTVSLLGSLFPMPRIIYAMAGDGLLFKFLANVSPYTETPAVACVVSGFLAALLSLMVSLRDLIEMMSIGTLLAYTLVSLCVLLLRYQPEGDIHGFVNFLSEEQKNKKKEGVLAECEKEACSPTSEADEFGGAATNTCGAKNLPSLGDNEMLIGKPDKNAYTASHPNYGTVDMTTGIEAEEEEGGLSRRLKKLIGPRYYTLRIRLGLPGKMDRPTPATGKIVTVCVLLFISIFAFCSFIIFGASSIGEGRWWALLLLIFFITFLVLLVIIILQQPENPKRLPYMAPCVPFVPVSAMLVNIYLMLKLSAITWIRFSIWCLVGVLIYFGYGMWNSKLEKTARENEVHASTYQRYDHGVDEGFCGFDDDFLPPTADAWGAQAGGSGLTPPPVVKPEIDGSPAKDGGRTVAKQNLAEEDPMDF